MDDSGRMAAALLKWSTFPVTRKPRPTIFTGDSVQVPGFKTVDAKIAFMTGNVRSDISLPPAVLDRLTDGHQETGGSSLVITSAQFASARFQTDRGHTSFPAWRLTVTDALAPITVLDPGIVSWWPPDEPFHASYAKGSDISADGLTLTHRFTGAASGSFAVTGTTATETDTAVIVDVATEFRGPAGVGIPGYAEEREATVRLTRPLGARVLIHPTGHPLPVASRPGR